MGTAALWAKRIILAVFWTAALLATVWVGINAAVIFRENRQPADVAPPEGALQAAADAKIYVQARGLAIGPPVLFIHGTGAWSGLWAETMAPLAQNGFHTLAMDVPPFGFSQKFKSPEDYATQKQAARILAVLAGADIKGAALVCHSVGCRAALEAVLQVPEAFSRLVMIDPALSFGEDAAHPHLEAPRPNAVARFALETPPLRDTVLGAWGTSSYSIAPIFQSFLYKKDAVTPARLKLLQQPLRLDGLTAAEGAWLQNLALNAETGRIADLANYKYIRLPVLLLWGRQDTVTPLWQGQALEKIIPGARLMVIDEAGHIPFLETPEAVNDALLQFLQPMKAQP